MKKLTKQYLNAVGNFALNQEKPRLILKELIETKDEFTFDYDGNEYIVWFEFVKENDVSAWIVTYVIPSPTVDELLEMGRIAEKKMPNLDGDISKCKVRFEFEENFFEVEFYRDSNGNIERGIFEPHFFDN